MTTDIRKQAVMGAFKKDNAADWKNIANREIEENKRLKETIEALKNNSQDGKQPAVIEIDPKLCRNWKYADRNKFEWGNLEELAEDIRLNGQVQPVILRKIPQEKLFPNISFDDSEDDKTESLTSTEPLTIKYEIIAGERRWRACLLGNIPLKGILTEQDDPGCLVIQTSENKKKSLSPYSLAIAYQKLMKDLHLSQNELARRLNIPKTSFSELMSFNKVPDIIWESVADMSRVKPKTAAFLSLTCQKSKAHLQAVIQLTSKIREGVGTDKLIQLIDKLVSLPAKELPRKSPAQIYQNKAGHILFRFNKEGNKFSLSKSILEKLDMDDFVEMIGKYLEAIE